MSKISIEGNASGTGTLTIAAPNTNTNRTLTLPDATGTLALAGAVPDKIEEGDSKVEVTDAGTGKVEVTVDNVEVADFTTGAIVFNETGANQDFRVEGDTNPNLFFVDASQDSVSVGAQILSNGFSVDASNTDFVTRFYNSNASPQGSLFYYSAAAPNGTTNWFIKCQDTGGERMYVRSNGGIGNYQGNDANLSDRREKTNFAPAKNYLDIICSIPIQTFNYIDQNHEEDPGLTLGVVAQDVQEVAPEFIMESDWGTEEEPKMRLSIYQTDLQYALMKSIQELKAELDQAKTRIAALENNNA